MTYLPYMLKRKPLYAALASATLSLAGYLGIPSDSLRTDIRAGHRDGGGVRSTPRIAPTAAQDDKQKKADKEKRGQSPSPTNLETVVVTSYRQSIDQNVLDKREANSIVEVINAQNIAQFPAKNIADALAHVPGVVISRESGEGKTVSIRGLAPELTYTQLNGNYVASADTSAGLTRSFNYTLFPANMFSDIKLYKSLEARLDEGGIGGNVDLRRAPAARKIGGERRLRHRQGGELGYPVRRRNRRAQRCGRGRTRTKPSVFSSPAPTRSARPPRTRRTPPAGAGGRTRARPPRKPVPSRR